MAPAKPKSKLAKPVVALRRFALGYPEAHEDHPWGETTIKVKGKVFLFLGRPEAALSLSAKLPQTGEMALTLPFAEPTGYGLGKSGWVTATFGAQERPPLDLLFAWIDESYRAVAPRKLVAQAPPYAPTAKTPRRPPARRA
jgi:predicted DNA-binding protein (MmcQ/YjbR family)